MERENGPIANSAANGVIDWSVLAVLAALRKPGAPDPRLRVIGAYLDSAPGLMEGIRAAIDASDGPALMTAAHSLKSSSMNVGARALGTLFTELEQSGKAGNLQRACDLLSMAQTQYEAVTTVFREFMQLGGIERLSISGNPEGETFPIWENEQLRQDAVP
jgi:HPt (histidine-containing phosphotransfer) domain-containing protein